MKGCAALGWHVLGVVAEEEDDDRSTDTAAVSISLCGDATATTAACGEVFFFFARAFAS